MKWFYAIDRQRQGPVSEEEFRRLVREGKIGPETLVWCQGMDDWKRYGDLPEAERTVPPEVTHAAEPSVEASSDSSDTAVCAETGRRLPKSQMFQYEGRWIATDHRELFFSRLRGEVRAEGTMEYAGFWVRVLAKLIDMLVLWMVGTIKDAALAFAMFGSFSFLQPGGAHATNLLMFYVWSIISGLAIGIGYYWFFLSRYQATPGKIALDLKVVRADGSKLSGWRIIGRYFAEMLSSFLLCIGYLMVAFDREQHRALHDTICDTRVVKNPKKD